MLMGITGTECTGWRLRLAGLRTCCDLLCTGMAAQASEACSKSRPAQSLCGRAARLHRSSTCRACILNFDCLDARAGGDACIFVSAFFFSLATVRLGKLASSFPTLRLAAAKSLVMALIAAGWLGTSALGQARPESQTPAP